MAEPRRMSTRFRGEPPPKKRALTPSPPPPLEKPVKHTPKPVEPVEDGLPMKLREGQAMPTLSEPQDENLPDKDFQSISGSGVLAAAIEHSRQKWMNDGIFDRYWTKPSKKKSMESTPQPEKSTMSRLGTCSLVIEPHAFEITLYGVKENTVPYQLPVAPPPPQTYSQYNPYSHNGNYVTPYGPPFTGTSTSDQRLSPHPQAQQSLPPFKEGFANLDARSPPPLNQFPIPNSTPTPTSRRPSTSSKGSHESKTREAPSADPVIQMLATRAASDPRLKSLMKIVAAGNASPEQLAEFQSHIDELNALLKSPQTPNPLSQANNLPKPPPGANASPPPSTDNMSPSNGVSVATSQQQQTLSAPQPPQMPIKTEPTTQHLPNPLPLPQFPPMRTHPPPPRPKADMQSIVFDFNGIGDRFTFPRQSILEYLPGDLQVLVSFLIIRRGSTTTATSTATKGASSKHYKGSQNYYQPVTMRLSATNARMLENLRKVVASPEEVRKYMEGIFDRMQPAEVVYLPLRLPRGKDAGGEGEEGGKVAATAKRKAVEVDRSLVRPFYEPPSSMMPLTA
ncbi:uncharacterized protein KY384_001844 [Bacidia gigantensis]|uniref:uncharacterized protein n=1 Tax=Bacidia gigantensis TaxID=2732470 RepID=UPI001D046D25|nr:uncharacterized protein KY384_001844 [Bacidia gigantensis]KAG8533061.1 hypothetical protein KY384_001844 [Bacidia gigantensis]